MDEEESSRKKKRYFRQKGSCVPNAKVGSLVSVACIVVYRGKATRNRRESCHTVMGPPCLSNGTLIQVLRDFRWGTKGDSGNSLSVCLSENALDKGAWQAIACGSKSWKDLAIKQY